MYTFNQPESTSISFGVVKQILTEFGINPRIEGPLAQSVRIFWPLDADLADRVRTGSTSLTDASTSEEQIRFFQRQRARRSYVKIASDISKRLGGVRVRIGNCHQLDEPSRDFLAVAADVCAWEIEYIPTFLETTSGGSAWTSEEQRILRVSESEELKDNLDEVWKAAFEFINVGDAWSGIALGRLMAQHEQTPRIWNLLALGYAMLNETENAEFYYRRWAVDGGDLDKVRAYYGISMLYARHHPAGLRSLDVAETYLADAYALLERMDPASRRLDAIVFEEVFNRNGHALVLFRRGEVDAALALLEWGIERLTETSEKVAIHRSVLMYNLAQCQRQLKNHRVAIAAYERLLRVDPYMPEYRFEAAKCYADVADLPSAIAAVRAGLDLDDSLASGWSLLGVYLDRSHDVEAASEAFNQAYGLDPKSPKYALDYAYALLLAGDAAQARDIVRDANPVGHGQIERRANLLAESWLKEDNIERAIEELESALNDYPDSDALARNLSTLRAK